MALSDTQFETLLNAVLERFSTPAPPLPLTAARHGSRVSWTGVPKLDFAQPQEFDTWFLIFESRMQAARAEGKQWLTSFLECPGVDESVKTRVRFMEILSHKELRLTLLREYGPVDPNDYFGESIVPCQRE